MGFTLAEIDKVLVPYCRKTYEREFERCRSMLEERVDDWEQIAIDSARTVLRDELRQGFQSLELKLNTVPCSRGDFAFTTLTFANCDGDKEDYYFQRMVCEVILETRQKGHNGIPVVFPKLVYLHSQKQYEEMQEQRDLFDKAVLCSSKCMYPDYLAIDADQGAVSRTYKQYGVVTSPIN